MQRLDIDPNQCAALTGAGSNRQYFRRMAPDGSSSIVTIGTNEKENQAFIYLSHYFAGRGLPVPEVKRVSADGLVYEQTDLGDDTLYNHLEDETLVSKTIDILPKFQLTEAIGIDFGRCFPVAEMDRQSIFWDLNYFKYCFLKPAGIEPDEPRLEREFNLLADFITRARPLGLILRDFQSRNVMIKDGNPYLIDFQGARRGPVHYDLVSFLWQTRAGFTPEFRSRMVERYIAAAGINRDRFLSELPEFIVFRMLQVLGAYGFRGLYERKSAFLGQIPTALHQLRQAINTAEFPYLTELTDSLINKFSRQTSSDHGVLQVDVMSFSYKKGLPTDTSGNGGGFVFDCRALPNPGRYDQYKQLTGRDIPVIEYLQKYSEVSEFQHNAQALVDQAVDNYIERGFTHLQVAFGCTGGRHRSLYNADRMAQHLRTKYPQIKVNLHHREHPQL